METYTWYRESPAHHHRPAMSVGNGCIQLLDTDESVAARPDQLVPMGATSINSVEDMITLKDIHEGALLFNLSQRFAKHHIYTFTGNILIALNPYKVFPNMYTTDMVNKYGSRQIGELSPHIFAIAAETLVQMEKTRQDQCVVISGESGAGKTESTKLIMKFLAAVNKGKSTVTEQVIETSPILEAFGNAKTLRNNNSSRFGKYLEIQYGPNVLIDGAKTTDYLLERSRVVSQMEGERNFHVFYCYLAGMSPKLKAECQLTESSDYWYLNQGNSPTCPGQDDVEDFVNICSSFDVLGFSQDLQDEIRHILAAILHLGNMEVVSLATSSGMEASQPKDVISLNICCKLLKIDQATFTEALFIRSQVTRGEVFKTPLKVEQAIDSRDAVAKALYGRLFSWIVERMNKVTSKNKKEVSVGVLDIFGFEDFTINSFEQLCINYANERLQYYFNDHIFKQEQILYANEAISFENVSFNDNQPCLDLISKKLGIIQMINEECNYPKGTDMTMLEKLHDRHESNPFYIRPKKRGVTFGIKHYAGNVLYTVTKFLDKNRDTLRDEVVQCLNSSSVSIVSRIFEVSTEDVQSTVGGRRKRPPTVGGAFHESLNSLIKTMAACNPFFVRCIKPNDEKKPMIFEGPLVLGQLRYSGMLETIRIRRSGYPVRLPLEEFLHRYSMIVPVPAGAGDDPIKAGIKAILEAVGHGGEDTFQIGKTRIFMREQAERDLEVKRGVALQKMVLVIQTVFRGYKARKYLKAMKRSIVCIQRFARMFLGKIAVQRRRKQILIIQSVIKMVGLRKKFLKHWDTVVKMKPKDGFGSPFIRGQALDQLQLPPVLVQQLARADKDFRVNNGIEVVENSKPLTFPIGLIAAESASQSFAKWAERYFTNAKRFCFSKLPLTEPLTKKVNKKAAVVPVVLELNKVIHRFMGDPNIREVDEGVIMNYMVATINEFPDVIDEVFCQLCSQVWLNPNGANIARGWLIFTVLANTFNPSSSLYSPLLGFVTRNCTQRYRALAQHGLLRTQITNPRTRGPTSLEWKAYREGVPMGVAIETADSRTAFIRVDPTVTAHEAVNAVLQHFGVESEGLDEWGGWGFSVDGDCFGGEDALFDHLGACEGFPDNAGTSIAGQAAVPANPAPLKLSTLKKRPAPSAPTGTVPPPPPPPPANANARVPLRQESVEDIMAEVSATVRGGAVPGDMDSEIDAMFAEVYDDDEADASFDTMPITHGKGGGPPPPPPPADAPPEADSLVVERLHLEEGAVYGYTPQKRVRLRKQTMWVHEFPLGKSKILVYNQVVNDVLDDAFIMINATERAAAKEVMRRHGVTAGGGEVHEACWEELLSMARKWELYFCKFFRVLDQEHRRVVIGISNQEIMILAPSKTSVVIQARAPLNKETKIDVYNGSLDIGFREGERRLFGHGDVIGDYVSFMLLNMATETSNIQIAVAIEDHVIKDPKVLSFRKGAVIILHSKKDRKVPEGWLFGTWNGHAGCFPPDFVKMAAVAPPPAKATVEGKVSLVAEETEVAAATVQAIEEVKDKIKKEEDEGPQMNAFGQIAAPAPLPIIPKAPSPPVNVPVVKPAGVARLVNESQGTMRRSVTNTHVDDSPEQQRRSPRKRVRSESFREKFSLQETEMSALPEGKFSMVEWAKENYRLDGAGFLATLKKKTVKTNSAVDTEKTIQELVRWTNRPVKFTLNKLVTEDSRVNKYVEESFRCIMRIMGDHRMGSKSDVEMVHIIIKLGMANTFLADEIFCQLIRQLTNNRSTNKDSLVRGWALALLLASFIAPSTNFFPFLRKYVHDVANDTSRPFSSNALMVEKTLMKVSKHGGRKVLPESPEVNAVLSLKFTRLQKVLFPSGISKTIKVHASTTVSDVLKDLCCNILHLTMEGASDYGLFVHPTLEYGTPLQLNDYVLDSTTILEKRQMAYNIYFKKVIWFEMDPLNDHSLCYFLFDQINHQFQQGLLIQQKQVTKSFLTNEISRLICVRLKLMNYRDGQGPLRTEQKFLAFVPRDIAAYAPQEVWVDKICSMWDAEFREGSIDQHQCFRMFLSIAREWPLYGGTFFRLQSVSDPRIQGPCLLNVDSRGVHFLDPATKEGYFSFNYEDIVSTRRLGSRVTDQHFIDFKIGNLMVQRVTRCQTNHSLDLVTVVDKYKELYMSDFSQEEE